jgi:hypothetical protein
MSEEGEEYEEEEEFEESEYSSDQEQKNSTTLKNNGANNLINLNPSPTKKKNPTRKVIKSKVKFSDVDRSDLDDDEDI